MFPESIVCKDGIEFMEPGLADDPAREEVEERFDDGEERGEVALGRLLVEDWMLGLVLEDAVDRLLLVLPMDLLDA